MRIFLGEFVLFLLAWSCEKSAGGEDSNFIVNFLLFVEKGCIIVKVIDFLPSLSQIKAALKVTVNKIE